MCSSDLDKSRTELPITMESGTAESLMRIENLPISRPRLLVTLEPMFTSGTKGVRTVNLRDEKQYVDFRLDLGKTHYSSYRATLKTVSGKTVLTRNFPKAPFLTLSVISKALSTGDHVIELAGRSKTGRFEPVADFYFNVRKP